MSDPELAAVTEAPSPPSRRHLPSDAPETKLVAHVRDALLALPAHFLSNTVIEGIDAGDLFSLNSLLGSTIERQVVDTLNRVRSIWDSSGQWANYRFERFPQSFPDVRLVAHRDGRPALGIELKGWYLLSREGEPSFRYCTSPRVCSDFDLLVVVPWHLKSVLSGVPIVHEPYVEQAAYAADFRNYYWQFQRGDGAVNTGIVPPPTAEPYPASRATIDDRPVNDAGGNFGRVARVHGLMEEYVTDLLSTYVAGLQARHWVQFFKLYTERSTPEMITTRLTRLIRRAHGSEAEAVADEILSGLRRLGALIEDPGTSGTSPP